MRIELKEDLLEIKTTVYQAKSGGVYMNWGFGAMLLEKKYADNIARDIPDFSEDDYNLFYKNI